MNQLQQTAEMLELLRPVPDALASFGDEERNCFGYGGVTMECFFAPGFGDRSVPWMVARALQGAESAVSIAHVSASLIRDDTYRPPAALSPYAVSWRWADDSAQLVTHWGRAAVRRTQPSTYAVAATVGPGSEALGHVLSSLATLAVNQEGGLLLHAAAVELAGAAVLFSGPSGAGKTTASNLVRDARMFAYDRVAIIPHSTGWHCVSVPFGHALDVELPESNATSLPLGALFRVFQGTGRPRIRPMGGAEALLWLRESVRRGSVDAADEERTLGTIELLWRTGRVAAITTVLGEPLDDLVHRFMGDREDHG